MTFAKEMSDIKQNLEAAGHELFLPEGLEEFVDWFSQKETETLTSKEKWTLIRNHYKMIQNSDAMLVVNYDKKGIKWYIGACSLMEMGFAFILNKRIYLRTDIPEMSYSEEILACEPIVINENLQNIT